ncbi:hypothetical protein BH18ACT4_BH18ACT4_14040 [soil metagenome]
MAQQPAAGRGPRPRALRVSEMLTVKDETDTAGRFLLEDSAPKQARKKAVRSGLAMRSVPCPYDDTPSRSGGVMNASAYEALRHDTAAVLDGFAWLGRGYYELNPQHRATVQGLLDVSNLGLGLPLVLLKRANEPISRHGAMPTFVASIFKASRGVFSVSVDMLNTKGPVPTTAPEVVRFADEHTHLLRAETGRACAAPTRLIERTLDVILTGEGADPERSGLGDLARFGDLWAFYGLQEQFNAAVSKYRWFLEQVSERAGRADTETLLATMLEDGGRRFSFGEFTAGFLDHVNSLQAGLNRSLGRADDAPPLTLQSIPQIL